MKPTTVNLSSFANRVQEKKSASAIFGKCKLNDMQNTVFNFYLHFTQQGRTAISSSI